MFVSGLRISFFLVFKNLNIPLFISICVMVEFSLGILMGDENFTSHSIHFDHTNGNVHSNPELNKKKIIVILVIESKVDFSTFCWTKNK